MITSQSDFASQLLKRIYNRFSLQRIQSFIKNFKIAPVVEVNPLTNQMDISYKLQSDASQKTAIEDVLNLIEKLGHNKSRPIVVFDEFQEIKNIGQNMDSILRSIMQYHKNINYFFLGSQESLIKEIFEKKKSPFYHFAYLFPLDKIPWGEFHKFLSNNFQPLTKDHENIADKILKITNAHPYYTQQLAFTAWEIMNKNPNVADAVSKAEKELVRIHDIDYERLWNTLNKTAKKILIGMSTSELSPLSNEFLKRFETGASSTVFSSLRKLGQNGLVVKLKSGYEIDDPFFKQWVEEKRTVI
ncbi:MAG: ATP-binding protein [Ignavibacteria bacterium]